MCEMRIIVEQDGREELLGENITKLEVSGNGITANSLFEGPRVIPEMVIDYIDFTAGKVVLKKQ